MWRWLALLGLSVLPAAGQNTIQAGSGPWTASLDGTWRWHAGDDLRWASPSLDDSNWAILRVPGPLPLGRHYWIRIHIESGSIPDPGLLLGPLAYAYQAYWDGHQLGHFGDLSRGEWFIPRWQIFRLPVDLTMPGAHCVAIRVGQIGDAYISRQPRLKAGESRVGDFAGLQEAESAYMRADLQPRQLQLLVDFGLLLAGIYFCLLPPSVSQGNAFRWLGVILLGRALVVMTFFYAYDGPLRHSDLRQALSWLFGLLSFIGTIEFSYALFRRRVPLPLRCFECFLIVLAAPVPIPYSARLFRFSTFLIPAVVPIALAAAEFRKRTAGARLILILLAIWGAATLNNVLAVLLTTVFHIVLPSTIDVAGFQLWSWDAALLLWVPAITMQIHKANLHFRDERERLRGEMEAARRVQEVLLPSRATHVPGFQIDASYQPANEVGGDFFQFFPGSNGSLLLIVGDVSGKGMKAALLVSVIVGALRNRKSDQPAEVLGQLNSVLIDQSEGGFTTCCCALFAADGKLALANAGHLAPYRNGREIETPPSLPLGVDPNGQWQEMHINLAPNDRILWLSDGVVEARNGKRDLLGFERAQELATQSASDIARAAQQFGQDDDITVVSVTRQPVPAYVA